MKATFFKEVGKPLGIENRPDPTPAQGEVVVKVGRCGICGSDLSMTSNPVLCFSPGFAMGHEFCGEVVAVGTNVTRFKQGDLLSAMPVSGCGECAACLSGYPYGCTKAFYSMGGFAEYALVKADVATRLPSSLSLVDGALVEPLAASLRAVTVARIQPGARIVVVGLGAMGMGVIYWARRLGAGKIVASARSPWREEMALGMGATTFIANDADFIGNTTEFLGGLPDIVFECTGAAGLIAEAVNLVRPRGTVLALGACNHPDPIHPFFAMTKEVCIQFTAAYSLQDFQYTVDILNSGAVEPRSMVTNTISLDELPAMFESLRGSNRQCKVMVDPWLQ